MNGLGTDEKIIEVLESRRGQSVSGEELAEMFSVSRAAIWKRIKKLKEKGYKIDAVNNSGYLLAKDDDKLSAGGIIPYLDKPEYGSRLYVYDELDSTNTEAKRRVIDGAEEGTVIIADSQTSGRGRLGRSFFSPRGSGIYLSFILKPKMSAEKSLAITAAVAVAVCMAIEKITGKKPMIKWVNDLYLDGKKICGILTEAVSGLETGNIDAVVIGIGINCTTVFNGDLKQKAGSLFDVNSDAVRNKLAAELINRLYNLIDMLSGNDFMQEYRKRSIILGKEITICNEPESLYTVEDIGDSGELVLKGRNGEKRVLNTGEVSIRLQK